MIHTGRIHQIRYVTEIKYYWNAIIEKLGLHVWVCKVFKRISFVNCGIAKTTLFQHHRFKSGHITSLLLLLLTHYFITSITFCFVSDGRVSLLSCHTCFVSSYLYSPLLDFRELCVLLLLASSSSLPECYFFSCFLCILAQKTDLSVFNALFRSKSWWVVFDAKFRKCAWRHFVCATFVCLFNVILWRRKNLLFPFPCQQPKVAVGITNWTSCLIVWFSLFKT